jgi:hypothetical protein
MKVVAAILMLLPLWGCAEQGSLERAGRNADNAIEDVREGVKDVVGDVREGVEDVRDDVGPKRKRK